MILNNSPIRVASGCLCSRPFFQSALLWIFAALWLVIPAAGQTPRILESRILHLRSGDEPEWDEFAGKDPDGSRLDLRFQSAGNSHEATLFVFQDDVKLGWRLELNGRRLGGLFLMETPLVSAVAIPAGGLVDGENHLAVIPPSGNDDIRIGHIELDSRPPSVVLSEATIEISVEDSDAKEGIPCRITVVDKEGSLAPLRGLPGQKLAVRPGVVYTPDGMARIGARAGDYTIYATRGFEFGLAKQEIRLKAGEARQVKLALHREVQTAGLVSCDTHTHTLTFSGHGDATIDERVITLAGEGIELPIATDHEHLTDLGDAASKMGVDRYFTPVIGCETTTAKGHFNSFPRPGESPVPNHRETDWPRLMKLIRATPDVRVVVLNHPRNVHNNFQPFASTNFNAITGRNLRGPEFEFDAIEVINSSALQSDIMVGFRDWFALLNYGYRVTAVASSDVHDVSRYIVGQGRTYIQCDDSEPSGIDVERACESLREGRALVSMGLLARIKVNGEFGAGDLARVDGSSIRVRVTVAGPSWVEADRVVLFSNGRPIRERRIVPGDSTLGGGSNGNDAIKGQIEWVIPRPKHDVHLVAIASGPAVTESYWAIPRPYQSASPTWNPGVIGATNPVWVDADRDGDFTAARHYAKAVVERFGGRVLEIIPALAGFDSMIAAQAASLCRLDLQTIRSPEISEALAKASESVREGFDLYAGAILGAEAVGR